jgi:NosR/NirI family nitrous oxide reductase transcriptional regulator
LGIELPRTTLWWAPVLVLTFCVLFALPARAAITLAGALEGRPAGELVPGADRFGPVEGEPARAAAYRGDELLGYVFLNTDVVGTIGYSGKPIHMLIALDTAGVITGAVLHKHYEPIVLIGIPERKVTAFIDGYVGRDVNELLARQSESERNLDIISGATVTIMVIDDSIVRSAIHMARALGLGGLAPEAAMVHVPRGTLDEAQAGTEDWITLIGDGSVRRLSLTVGEVSDAFESAGKLEAAARPESADAGENFIDLYTGLVSAPVIGESLLGNAEYEH